MQEPKQITHFRRYPNYDYSLGGSIFISFHLDPRYGVFGNVTADGQMLLSQAGLILDETIRIEQQKHPEIKLRTYKIMPEHLHLRLTFPPRLPKPLQCIGRFVQEIKRWSKAKLERLGIHINWQKNYHDLLCLSKDVNERVDEYIAQNPMKWVLMHSQNPPMKVVEPLCSPLFIPGEWWSGVGNANLLHCGTPLLAIRLSRRLTYADISSVIPNVLNECQRRVIPISTFISPAERCLFDILCGQNIPMICAVPDALRTIYRPRTEHTKLFAQNQLMLLSHFQGSNVSRHEAWNRLNYDIARLAQASGGKAIYIKPSM